MKNKILFLSVFMVNMIATASMLPINQKKTTDTEKIRMMTYFQLLSAQKQLRDECIPTLTVAFQVSLLANSKKLRLQKKDFEELTRIGNIADLLRSLQEEIQQRKKRNSTIPTVTMPQDNLEFWPNFFVHSHIDFNEEPYFF